MKVRICFVKISLFISLLTILFIFIFFPFLCNTYLLPHFVEKLPFSHTKINLSKVTPWEIKGTLTLSHNGQLITTIPRFEIQYSPTSLLKKEIDTILLDSPTLHLNYVNDTVSIPGVEGKPTKTEKAATSISIASPVSIKNIIIKNSHIALHEETKSHNLIVNSQIELHFTPKGQKAYTLSTFSMKTLTEGDLTLNSSIQGVFSPQNILFDVKFNSPDLKEIIDLIPQYKTTALDGTLAAVGQVSLNPDMNIAHCFASIDINAFKGSLDRLQFAQTSPEKPVQIEVNGNDQTLNFKISGVSTKEPEETDILSFGKIDVKNKSITGTTTIHSKRLNSSFIVETNGKARSTGASATLRLTGDSFNIAQNILIGPIKMQADISYADKIMAAEVTGTVDNIQSSSDELFFKNINWDIPLHFPLQKGEILRQGQFNIGSLQYKKVKTAGLATVVQQTAEGFKYSADVISQMDLKGQIHCEGSMRLTGNLNSACTLANTTIDSSLLPDFIKIPDETTFTGILAAKAAFELDGTKQQGTLTVHLLDGTLTSGETVVSNIETTIDFPNLPNLQSKPSQIATIRSIESGKFRLQNGKITFRLEEDQQLFLEKARLSWCGGKIEMGSLKLNSHMTNLETTVYCDRLNFIELLEQFGVEDTEGEGSLNGRLPIAINDNGINFDDGFLFSTPGNSGIVRFNNTDQLLKGMPDIGQTATLDYSIKALENFAYNWTKLSFKTEGKDLLLTMQLDGQPATPLPFGYKNGQIVATEQGAGLQHPLRLDMNFRLPLQEIFQSGKSLQSLMEKM